MSDEVVKLSFMIYILPMINTDNILCTVYVHSDKDDSILFDKPVASNCYL